MQEPKNRDEALRTIVGQTLPKLQQVINEAGIDGAEAKLCVEDNYPYIISKSHQYGRHFALDAGIETSWIGYPGHPEGAQIPTATIRNLTLGENFRRRGIGSRIVRIWEKTLSEHGITSFTASKISNEDAVKFWKKQGYQIPDEEAWKQIPYWMYKTIEKTI